ncbi:MAG: prepilin-type N-terminal cleavage/methylation domain-containing protein [Thermoanaerobaculales bacterium]|nr:prepilin-type N-terminal cleavage/methylation domain-containing protein [Thermoanaerobaculales bacterium]
MKRPISRPSKEKGESLVEVLAALAILLIVLVGVLQLFTMALFSFHGTSAHAEMVRRGEAVVEIIRLVRSSGASGTSGILPLAVGTRQLPVAFSDIGFDFWGPAGFGIVEHEARYRVSYAVTDGGADWVVSVFVEPNTGSTGNKYLGSVGGKAVRYAARIRK